MPTDLASRKMLVDGAAEHPAVRAWQALRPGGRAPRGGIELLKGRKGAARRSAYRLIDMGPGGVSVIAKRYPRAKAAVERLVYEDVLPNMPVRAPRFYGCVEEADGASCWLFLEDLGRERYCPASDEHRRLAARWLGQLHALSGALVPPARLADLGPACWLGHVRSARRRIEAGLGNAALASKDREVLGEVLGVLGALERGWGRVERRCEAMPRALVHGDFVAKNIGVRAEDGGVALVPFDWGQAGWGPPAVDLGACPPELGGLTADVDVTAYWETVRGHWPGVGLAGVRDWVAVGTLARCVMAMDWEAASLGSGYVTESVARMGLYGGALAGAVRAGRTAL
jgi:hypothetical protein